jgi:hypothetical protein
MVASAESSMETSMKDALAAALAAHQRAGDGEGRRDAADAVGDRIAGAQRRALGVAGDAHHPRQALDDLVVGRRVAHRALLAEARDGAVDEPGLTAFSVLVAKAQPRHHAGAEVLDQHVGALDQGLRSTALPASLFRFSVIDFLPPFCARNEAPMQLAVELGDRCPAGAPGRPFPASRP